MSLLQKSEEGGAVGGGGGGFVEGFEGFAGEERGGGDGKGRGMGMGKGKEGVGGEVVEVGFDFGEDLGGAAEGSLEVVEEAEVDFESGVEDLGGGGLSAGAQF